MTKQSSALFLDYWLRSSTSNVTGSGSNSGNVSAQRIIQSWAELRDCLRRRTFLSQHLDSLKALVNSQASLYVADPQAKLVISVLSSTTICLPDDAYPLLLRLLYIWVRKSFKLSSALADSAIEAVAHLFTDQFDAKKNISLFAEGVLVIGAFSFSPLVAQNTKIACLQLLCNVLEEKYYLIGSVGGGLFPNVLGGVGYALSSSGEVHFVRLLKFLLGKWVELEVPHDLSHALAILHLIEWVLFGFLSAGSLEKIRIFRCEIIENLKTGYAKFAVLMAIAGALRASNRLGKHVERLDIVSALRASAETRLDTIASDLILEVDALSNNTSEDTEVSFLLQCLSLAAARSGGLFYSRGPLALCLALALLIEVLPLRKFYSNLLESPLEDLGNLTSVGINKHQDSILLKEAGATSGVFCNLYASLNEIDKCKVESLIWSFCHDVYIGHRQVVLLLRGRSDQLLTGLEKIAESAFLMAVVFSLAVTKHKLTSKFSKDIHSDVSVKILSSFSCMEYFRHIRLPEYMEAIRSVATTVQDDESACVSFVETLPSYCDLTNPEGFSSGEKDNYLWSKDDVQTARILFYLRVIPTCINRLPGDVFQRVVAATMLLYMGHPNIKAVRASHSVFSSFVSSEKESDQDERSLLKEKLVFYYMKRSLEEYPGNTAFDGLASGVAALVRYLPAGSPSIYYCVHSLAEKAEVLFGKVMTHKDTELWTNWQGDSDPCKKILELLLRLLSLVDIQVLPELMKLLAQLVVQLPKDGQNMVLDELYPMVADSDDVTRKPALVSWLQSLSFIGSQSKEDKGGESTSKIANSLGNHNLTARL